MRSHLSDIKFHGLGIALIIYLSLALSYAFIVPIFEGPDEWTHTGHVKYIAEGNGLPIMLPGQGIWGGQQPPLYFVGAARLMQGFDLSAFEQYEPGRKNPHASLGYALDPGNKNNYLHYSDEAFPYTGLALAVHSLRLYSMLFGVMTLIFTYLTAYELAHPETRSLSLSKAGWFRQAQPTYSTHATTITFPTAVALFMACQPMFAFMTAVVSNEPAVMAFCALVVWLSQRYILHGPSRSIGRATALGVALGLVSLAKMTGLSVGLVAVLAFLQAAILYRKQPHAARWLWRDGLIIGLSFLLVGGWWYWRNYQLYGDFFQTRMYELYFNDKPDPLTLSHFLFILRSSEVSFWATFGWLNIVAPQWVYDGYGWVSRVGIAYGVGCVAYGVLRRRGSLPKPTSASSICVTLNGKVVSALFLHAIFPIILAFSLTRLVAIEGGMQGRQLLPALGSLAILIVWGWRDILRTVYTMLIDFRLLHPTPNSHPLTIYPQLLIPLSLLAIAIYLPFGVVRPEYHPRPLLSEAALPSELTRLNWVYNDDLMLVGVQLDTTTVKPGEPLFITTYWQALRPMTTNYSVFTHLIGRDYQNIGQFNSYPGLGLRPTSTLAAGQIVKDRYPVRVEADAEAPTRLRLNMGLFKFEEPGRPGIQPLTTDGIPIGPTVADLKLIPHSWPIFSPNATTVEFADSITLNSHTINGCQTADAACTIHFNWQATGKPSHDYTVFIQLWQQDEQLTGFDQPPLAGQYPTHLWDSGEVIIDPHPLNLSDLQSGQYDLFAGLYNRKTGLRLPIISHNPPPNFMIPVGRITLD